MDDNDVIIGIVLACVVGVHQLITAYSILFGLPTFLVRQAIHIFTYLLLSQQPTTLRSLGLNLHP